MTEPFRLNKYISHSGICSRRKAAELVKAGKIKVNGQIEKNPAILIQPGDKVEFQGKILKPVRDLVYILMNKPKDVVTTAKDERGRKTVMDIISGKVQHRVFPVGRLDRASTGLLLLTNDGDLAKKLTHPKHRVKKLYHVVLDRKLSPNDMEKIKAGLQLDDGPAEVDQISYIKGSPQSELGLEIHMGKNRIIRRIFEHLGYKVKKLDRVLFAGLTKKDIPRGRFRKLTNREIIMLKHFV